MWCVVGDVGCMLSCNRFVVCCMWYVVDTGGVFCLCYRWCVVWIVGDMFCITIGVLCIVGSA